MGKWKKVSISFFVVMIVSILIYSMQYVRAIEEIKQNIAFRLLTEYKQCITDLEKKHNYYSEAMAADKAIGILGVYRNYYHADDLAWVTEKQKSVHPGDFSTIYFSYSKSGKHFIAFAQPSASNSYKYGSVADQIKGDSSESSFINSFRFDTSKGYYVIDLFTEDLLNRKDKIEVDVKIEYIGSHNELITAYPIAKPNDSQVDAILEKYQREYSPQSIAGNKEWKLFIFDRDIAWPKIIVSCDGEEIILVMSGRPLTTPN